MLNDIHALIIIIIYVYFIKKRLRNDILKCVTKPFYDFGG